MMHAKRIPRRLATGGALMSSAVGTVDTSTNSHDIDRAQALPRKTETDLPEPGRSIMRAEHWRRRNPPPADLSRRWVWPAGLTLVGSDRRDDVPKAYTAAALATEEKHRQSRSGARASQEAQIFAAHRQLIGPILGRALAIIGSFDAWADDLRSAAEEGLLRAVRGHDPAKGPFENYARVAIHHAIWKPMASRLDNLRREAAVRRHVLAAADDGTRRRTAAADDGTRRRTARGNTFLSPRALGDDAADPPALPDLHVLTDRERFVLAARLAGEQNEQADIAAVLNVSRQRVSQIERGALVKLGRAAA
jgi:DNA-directed RNA polymerase specialized sigma subunit